MAKRRITLNLDDHLLRTARELSGIEEKSALVDAALRHLIARAASQRLIALGGTMPKAAAGRRQRSVNPQ